MITVTLDAEDTMTKDYKIINIPVKYLQPLVDGLASVGVKDDIVTRRADFDYVMKVWKERKKLSDEMYARGEPEENMLKLFLDRANIEENYGTTMAIINGIDDKADDKVTALQKKLRSLGYENKEVPLMKYESKWVIPILKRINQLPKNIQYYPAMKEVITEKVESINYHINGVGESYVKIRIE